MFIALISATLISCKSSPDNEPVGIIETNAGYALLSWIPPTQRDDGTLLNQLAGYKIYHGLTPETLELEATVSDPLAINYYFEDLPSGTHYFAVQAYDQDGGNDFCHQLESALSKLVSKTIY